MNTTDLNYSKISQKRIVNARILDVDIVLLINEVIIKIGFDVSACNSKLCYKMFERLRKEVLVLMDRGPEDVLGKTIHHPEEASATVPE